jgi:hypothetical protein
MKKISIGIISLIAFSLLSATALATSGECSYHGGVNCSAGANFQGYAVCKDGWVSSVPYSQTDECQQANPCPAPLVIGCTDQSELQLYQNEQTQEANSCRALNARSGNYGASCDDPSLDTQISSCQQEIQDYQAEVQGYNKCIAGIEAQAQQQAELNMAATCSQLPNAQWNSTSNSCVCNSGYLSVGGVCTYFDPATILGLQNTSACPANSTYTGNECICNTGYKADLYKTFCAAEAPATTTPSYTIITPPVITPAATSTPIFTSFLNLLAVNQNLKTGSSGNDVISLQKFLEAKGILTLPAGTTEGYFGSLTKQALISFQISVGLPATGYFGPMTRAAINGS